MQPSNNAARLALRVKHSRPPDGQLHSVQWRHNDAGSKMAARKIRLSRRWPTTEADDVTDNRLSQHLHNTACNDAAAAAAAATDADATATAAGRDGSPQQQ